MSSEQKFTTVCKAGREAAESGQFLKSALHAKEAIEMLETDPALQTPKYLAYKPVLEMIFEASIMRSILADQPDDMDVAA